MNKSTTPSAPNLLKVDNREIPLQIYYESRGNSRVSITKKGVILRISRYMNRIERDRQIDDFRKWALRKLEERPELCTPQRKDFYTGKVIAVRDKSFVLQLSFTEAKNSVARLSGNMISIKLSSFLSEERMEKTVTLLISKCVARVMHPWVQERLTYWNELHFHQRKFRTLRLKYANSLWGSCSREGSISISTRLLLAPDHVIDYVLVHELAHLVVPDHSKRFWQVVSKAYPDFEASERWLKENGRRCDF